MRGSAVYGFVALAIVMLSIGTAMAMWSETLRMNVQVNTGEVDVKWSDYYTNDNGIDPGYDKDVASCEVVAEEYDSEGDVIKLRVTISNAYPSYTCVVTGIVDNIGTIPVKLLSHQLVDVPDELTVTEGIPEDTQIDPGMNATYTLTIHVEQSAAENATYTFEWVLTFAQWNEVGEE